MTTLEPSNPEDARTVENDPSISDDSCSPEEAEPDVGEDDPSLLSPETRSLEGGVSALESGSDAASKKGEVESEPAIATPSDDTTDVASITEEEETQPKSETRSVSLDWEVQASARKVIVELKQLESEVRSLLEDRDTRRKRKFAGTYRWMELLDDIITWQYSDRMDESTVCRLRQLINRRQHLFQRLRFLASTRPVWNS